MGGDKTLSLRILNTILNRKAIPSFSKLLGIPKISLSEFEGRIVKFRLTVPANLCVKYSNHHQPQLALSAAVALFDELSTSGLVLKDRTCRPGVSVQLDGKAHAPAVVGEDVIISTNAVKIGANLAFCKLELHDLSGKLLASGNHIKYLPMGKYWDKVFGSPMILKLLIPLVEEENKSFVAKKLQAVVFPKRSKNVESQETEILNIDSVFDRLGVAKTASSSATYLVKGDSYLNNPMGKMHGGALAMAIEQAISLQVNSQFVLTEMDLRYLNAVKKSIEISIGDFVDDRAIASEMFSVSGVVKDVNTNIDCVHFACNGVR